VLPYRSDIAKLADFAFGQVDESYPERARQAGQHAIVGGANYGQGSSREHAAIVPRYLGLRLVIAKSYARIHWQNLVSFGVLPLEFASPATMRPSIPATLSPLKTCGPAWRRAQRSQSATSTPARNTGRCTGFPPPDQIVLAGGQSHCWPSNRRTARVQRLSSRSRTSSVEVACRVQWAQQQNSPATSAPWPITRQPQCSHTGAIAWMAHSKLSNTCRSPGGDHLKGLVVVVPAHLTRGHVTVPPPLSALVIGAVSHRQPGRRVRA
jgi:hypothetical protein